MPMGAVDIVSRALCRYPDTGEARERELNSVSCYARVHRVAANWPGGKRRVDRL